jgi:membrane dipeptidase
MHTVFDLHCDTPHNIYKKDFNHIDPRQLHRQHYLGAVFAHFVYPRERYPFVEAIRLISATIAYIKKLKTVQIIRSFQELDKNRVNIILGVEGGHIFDNTFKQIEVLYHIGVRVFTLTWNNSNKLAHSALRADKKGLTKKGKAFLKELKKYDVIVDLSHASTRTVLDVCDVCENQVIASHSCVRSLHPTYLRNIDDRAIKAIAQKGGVIGVNISRHHLGNHRIIEHIGYIHDNFGIDVAALGTDFDGVNDAVITSPTGLRQVEKELLKKGYKNADVEKIFNKNFLRVFKEAIS